LVRIAGGVAIGVVAFVFIFSLFAPNLSPFLGGGRGGLSGFEEKIRSAGTLHIPRDQPVTHEYTSVPATSGHHYDDLGAPARWGVHDDPIPDEVLVHNLEHAGVGIHYNCPEGCDELIVQLKAIASRAQKVIMSPYPGMDARIALTAWTYLDKFDEFNEERVRAFINAHVNSDEAPEPFAN
jgi:hypothetical protein